MVTVSGVTSGSTSKSKNVSPLVLLLSNLIVFLLTYTLTCTKDDRMSIFDAVTSSAENKDAQGSQMFASTRRASNAFEQIYQLAYERAVDVMPKQTKGRQPFHLATWKNRTNGGLLDSDRKLLGRLYEEANSVLEYGLGESTRIAAHVGVPSFVGIDSDAAWVAQARDASPNHFRFHMGDIGPTREWGFPVEPKLAKSVLQYELVPLWMEAKPFDVYFIDGRWRPATVLLSFLHASARGDHTNMAKVGIHDYIQRTQYHRLEEILQIVDKSERAAFFKRKPDTTDQDILTLWKYYDRICRRDLPREMESNVDAQRDLGC